eukprot:CAMPEP_0185555088 /NCGR_PEP_ID=MMETSP1381-20130426/43397_1 /TAXON_ID=298111 /ORGANISM="Pavlova sp., Strain CCMP459" /LENGTH=62 /DNA_ID=CAMNT_0028168365 /DNA_START=47 /DNA_END=232 /DNA_ORIENTATION=+
MTSMLARSAIITLSSPGGRVYSVHLRELDDLDKHLPVDTADALDKATKGNIKQLLGFIPVGR